MNAHTSRMAGGLAVVFVAMSPLADAASCASLASAVLPNTNITSVEAISAGDFTAPDGTRVTAMPAFCEVHGLITPTPVSQINFEVWLPLDTWNQRFNGVGNGGLAGTIPYAAMGTAVKQGFASAGTDTGHVPTQPQLWLESTDRVIDYSYRGLHLTTQNAKQLLYLLYGSPAQYSYYTGCSTGGKQGLFEAQKFPEDYDGLVAGDSANFWTHAMDNTVWVGQATIAPETNLSDAKLLSLNTAVLNACGKDGPGLSTDAFLTNPLTCNFDPSSVQCTGVDSNACLTSAQVGAVRRIYQGPTNPRTGENIYPGLVRGSENAWGSAGGRFLINRTVAQGPGVSGFDWFRYAVFQNPSWDYTTFNFDTDAVMHDLDFAAIANSTDPNLFPLRDRGHKLIIYHGFSDPLVTPANSIGYYEDVIDRVLQIVPQVSDPAFRRRLAVGKTQFFARLFMVPGLHHCTGGPGPTSFDFLPALQAWVENGTAPDQVIASRVESGVTKFTRPLCPYPQSAWYKGAGDTTDAANFECHE